MVCPCVTDLPTGWEEGYTFEGARCFIKWVWHPPRHTCHHFKTCGFYSKNTCHHDFCFCLHVNTLWLWIREPLLPVAVCWIPIANVNDYTGTLCKYDRHGRSVVAVSLPAVFIYWDLPSLKLCSLEELSQSKNVLSFPDILVRCWGLCACF